jgi:hypothetical protein
MRRSRIVPSRQQGQSRKGTKIVVNWDVLSAIAEVFGAVAVVVSLIYLASQIRQANVQAQGEAHSNYLTAWNETIKGWISDRDTVEILQRGFAEFSTLPNVEQAIFAQQVAALINHWHLAADLVERGLLDEQLYRGTTDVVLSVCATPGGRQFVESNSAAFPRGPQLLELVQSGAGSLPPFNILSPWWSIDDSKPDN